jgi:hypothetical protein
VGKNRQLLSTIIGQTIQKLLWRDIDNIITKQCVYNKKGQILLTIYGIKTPEHSKNEPFIVYLRCDPYSYSKITYHYNLLHFPIAWFVPQAPCSVSRRPRAFSAPPQPLHSIPVSVLSELFSGFAICLHQSLLHQFRKFKMLTALWNDCSSFRKMHRLKLSDF